MKSQDRHFYSILVSIRWNREWSIRMSSCLFLTMQSKTTWRSLLLHRVSATCPKALIISGTRTTYTRLLIVRALTLLQTFHTCLIILMSFSSSTESHASSIQSNSNLKNTISCGDGSLFKGKRILKMKDEVSLPVLTLNRDERSSKCSVMKKRRQRKKGERGNVSSQYP